MWSTNFRTTYRELVSRSTPVFIGPRRAILGLSRLHKEEDATTVPEYTVMLALIVLVAIGAISGIGLKVNDVFAALDSGVQAGTGG